MSKCTCPLIPNIGFRWARGDHHAESCPKFSHEEHQTEIDILQAQLAAQSAELSALRARVEEADGLLKRLEKAVHFRPKVKAERMELRCAVQEVRAYFKNKEGGK